MRNTNFKDKRVEKKEQYSPDVTKIKYWWVLDATK